MSAGGVKDFGKLRATLAEVWKYLGAIVQYHKSQDGKRALKFQLSAVTLPQRTGSFEGDSKQLKTGPSRVTFELWPEC